MQDILLFVGAGLLAAGSIVWLWRRGSWPGAWPVEGEPVILALIGALVYLVFQMGAIFIVSSWADDVAVFHLGVGLVRVACIIALLTVVRLLVHNDDPMHKLYPPSLRESAEALLPYLLILPLMMMVAENAQQQAVEDLLAIDDLWPRASLFFHIVIAAPLLEELLFRGFLQGALRRAYPASVAVPATAACFAIVHEQSVAIPVFVLGLLLGAVYEKTRAFWAPWLIHTAHNFLTFVFIVAGGLNA